MQRIRLILAEAIVGPRLTDGQAYEVPTIEVSSSASSPQAMMSPTPIPRFIVEDQVKQIRAIGPASHFGFCDLADSLQALLDLDESHMPLGTEVANAFKNAEKLIERDFTLIQTFLQNDSSISLDVADRYASAARELPWAVARLAGIHASTSLDEASPSFELLSLIEAKNNSVCFGVFCLQHQLTSLFTLLQLSADMRTTLPTNNVAMEGLIATLLFDKFEDLGVILTDISEKLHLQWNMDILKFLQPHFRLFGNQAEKESQRDNTVV